MHARHTWMGLAATLALAGCASPGLTDATFPTGSRTVATSSDHERVYVVTPDAGAIAIAGPDGAVERIDVGVDPTRLARAGDQVFVSLRGESAVAVLRESGAGLTLVDRVEVGADPVGVVASEDGSAVFVAAGLSEQIVRIDPVSLDVVARYAVGGQPRWLALHPSGRTLYAGSAMGGTWSSIDLETDEVTSHRLPERVRFAFTNTGEHDVVMTPRITGDLSVTPQGDMLAVPVLYVDNSTPVGDPAGDRVDSGGGYASDNGGGTGRTNPVITLYDLADDGTPDLASVDTLFASGTRSLEDGRDEDVQQVRSYLASTAFSPDGMVVLGLMEGSEAVVSLPLRLDEEHRGRVDTMIEPGFGEGFTHRSTVAIATDVGPRGLVFTDRDTAVVDTWIDRTLAEIPYRDARDVLASLVNGEAMDFEVMTSMQARASTEVAPSLLTPEQEVGRRMFFRATDTRMAAHSGGISCATCHYEGRNDGLTWVFEEPGQPGLTRERQTPSLAGPVSQTEPVTWTDSVATVATEVRLTSQGRMGGSGVTTTESLDVAAFIDTTPYPSPVVTDAAAVDRGRVVFFDDAGCADCHHGELYTDAEPYEMFGLASVRTPTLRGIAASAPYLHDGSAETLEELVEVAEDGGMGRTNHLSEAQKADLVAFLESL